jgi:hypothetical protein
MKHWQLLFPFIERLQQGETKHGTDIADMSQDILVWIR